MASAIKAFCGRSKRQEAFSVGSLILPRGRGRESPADGLPTSEWNWELEVDCGRVKQALLQPAETRRCFSIACGPQEYKTSKRTA